MSSTNDFVIPLKYTQFEDSPPDYDLVKAANGSIHAIREIESTFDTFGRYLAVPGIANAQKLLVSMNKMKTDFRRIIRDSRGLAVEIAQYAGSFDQVIIRFCDDLNITTVRRTQRIGEFIAESDAFKSRAQVVVNELEQLEHDFAALGEELLAWARTNSWGQVIGHKRDAARAKKANYELQKIDEQLRIVKSIIVHASRSMSTLPGMLKLAKQLIEPISTALVAFGTFIGLKLAPYIDAVLGKSCRLNKGSGEIAQEMADLRRSIDSFAENINTIAHLWENVVNDAKAIQRWLEGGANVADTPEHMKSSLKGGANVYKSMAQYLQAYSHGA